MQKMNNKVLSWLHYIVAVIVVFDAVYILNYSLDLSKDNSSYLIGSVVGKLILVGLHITAAKFVQKGRTKDRLLSLFLTIFILASFPIGTLLGVVMLIFIFKWDTEQPASQIGLESRKSES